MKKRIYYVYMTFGSSCKGKELDILFANICQRLINMSWASGLWKPTYQAHECIDDRENYERILKG